MSKIIVYSVSWIICFGLTSWGFLALWFGPSGSLGSWLAVLFVIATAPALVFVNRIKLQIISGIAILSTLVWFFSLSPSSSREWAADVAVMPWAEVNGDYVTLHNIRNFNYRTENDFDINYYTRTFDINSISAVDLFISFWGSEAIAHPIVSFQFSDGEHLAFSVETRKERSESYSAINGFFRQYELIYIAASERDVIRLRTNYRNETVYLHRLQTPIGKAKAVLLDYIEQLNQLHSHPAFYNALTDNCTTNIFTRFSVKPPYPSFSIGIILPGYLDSYLYNLQKKTLNITDPFEEYRAKAIINPLAQAADQDPDFSNRIRTNQ